MKKALLLLCCLASGAFANVMNLGGTFVLQNQTQNTLSISYQTCSWSANHGNIQSICNTVKAITLSPQSNNFADPIKELSGDGQAIEVLSVKNLNVKTQQNFSIGECVAHTITGANGVISFSSIINTPLVQCTPGSFQK